MMMIEEVHRGPPLTVRYFVFLPMLANQVRSRSPLSERLSHIRPRNNIETESLQINQILQSLKIDIALSDFYIIAQSCLVLYCLCFLGLGPVLI